MGDLPYFFMPDRKHNSLNNIGLTRKNQRLKINIREHIDISTYMSYIKNRQGGKGL